LFSLLRDVRRSQRQHFHCFFIQIKRVHFPSIGNRGRSRVTTMRRCHTLNYMFRLCMSLRSTTRRRRLSVCSFSMLTLLLYHTPPASCEFEPLHCLACGVGFFRDQPTKTCSACPLNSSTFTYSNATSHLHCLKPGFENSSHACELCDSEFFKGVPQRGPHALTPTPC
jgi:hypothetical protein